MATEPSDDMPNIRLEKDDLESFHRTRAQSTSKNSKNKTPASDSVTESHSPSWLAILVLLTVIVSAAAYWSFEQHKVLLQAQSRISELESRLSATGEDMDQSAAALQVKVSELSTKTEDLWSQMDKLWASAWRRNQAEIGELNKTVMALKAFSEKSTENLNSEAADISTSLGLVKEQLEKQASAISQFDDRFSQLNQMDVELEQQQSSLQEKVISTALGNNNLTDQIDDLRRRVATTEKRLKEINLPIASVTVP